MELLKINVNEHTEKKNGLTYLSWAWAWSIVLTKYPQATYEVIKFDGVPYVSTDLGIMCFTKVTIENVTHEMWLPVLDSKNNAMKNAPYEYKTAKGTVHVAAADMFDVNKTLMRCLVKNLAMFGLGLYIYAGEDLPESERPEPIEADPAIVAQIKSCADLASLRKLFASLSEDQRIPAMDHFNYRKKELA